MIDLAPLSQAEQLAYLQGAATGVLVGYLTNEVFGAALRWLLERVEARDGRL
jgi:hypothetical protein